MTALKAVAVVHDFLRVMRSNQAHHIHRFSLTASQCHLRQARFDLKINEQLQRTDLPRVWCCTLGHFTIYILVASGKEDTGEKGIAIKQ